MTTYYVWKDNLLEELFAMEKSDFEQQTGLKTQLAKEHTVLHTIEAEDWKNALDIYREQQAALYGEIFSDEEDTPMAETTPVKNTLH